MKAGVLKETWPGEARVAVVPAALTALKRAGVEVLVEAAYQGCGYRRVKNPRIWSLHDIAVLGEEG